ncbi:hypothetical protein V6858_001916 [Providencia rettgeri]
MDKSRQQFEEWIADNAYLFMHINLTYHEAALYKLWQASRESLEIELPQRKGICHNEYESGYFDGIDKCEDVLIRSGVKIKNE